MTQAELVLTLLTHKPMTTHALMRVPLPDGGNMLRPQDVAFQLRRGTNKRPPFDVKECPVGKARMALYSLPAAEKKRAAKYLSQLRSERVTG
jgi:hypothetical protein